MIKAVQKLRLDLVLAAVAAVLAGLLAFAPAESEAKSQDLTNQQARELVLGVLRIQTGVDIYMSQPLFNQIDVDLNAQTEDGRISGEGDFVRTQEDLAGTLYTKWHGQVDTEDGEPVAADIHARTVARTEMTIDKPGTEASEATIEEGGAITYRYDWTDEGYRQYGTTQNVKGEALVNGTPMDITFNAKFDTVVVGNPFRGGSIDTNIDTKAVTRNELGTHNVEVEVIVSPGRGGRNLKFSEVIIDGEPTDVGLTANDL